MAAKRKAAAMAANVTEEPVDPADELMFLCLGGGNEVGRSCHIVQYKGKTVMVSTRHIRLRRETGPLNALLYSSTPVNTLPTMASLVYLSSMISI